ncbi:hypothetical protein NP233_g162 [Leucocoprinus birnbaumii]|uniref:non-specific serine/threonine protein kinase n=1 Tax=Leucocoprinus birnbaumii TaxID=56174 RepID=A0AAD5W449_9AGAR|nr:hypothetical protein NP233_g162 [Leucocoprinus birnbaumii]
MSSFLDQYEPLDIIGNGSFGIIRKVRRKADGMVFARKELNFERMTERDRKQIVSEVNILKELNNEHIVRYHDRHVDREAGILYILMEYCGGGDLSNVIKQAAKSNRLIPEDTIWNYFMQILLALHHCHHPNSHVRDGSSGTGFGDDTRNGSGSGARERRAQILHRDLKPDNVFLDEHNHIKLGDFGLSKALSQSSFANTYVGTPYYMSPELMQEKAYDTKSDIWSLGCLIFELCALKPPFHEAKTHSELSMCIRNGRIPPLPRGYSQSLSAAIKAMLNLNPALRPSAAQLLQHERVEASCQVSQAHKLLSQVKAHRAAVLAKEREVLQHEEALRSREERISNLLSEKDAEIARLQAHVAHIQQHTQITQRDVEIAIRQALARREEELRVLVQRREEEVASATAKREEEIMEAVRRREAEAWQAWCEHEAKVRQEVEISIRSVQERVEWIEKKEEELKTEEERIAEMKEEVEQRMRLWEASQKAGKVQKAPLEEVKNILEPINGIETPIPRRRPTTMKPTTINNELINQLNNHVTPKPTTTTDSTKHYHLPALQTPIMRPNYTDTLPSAMKGVVLTATGETLATPSPNELAKLFTQSPRVGLGFTKIFESDTIANTIANANLERLDKESDGHHGHHGVRDERRLSSASTDSEGQDNSPPPSPSARKEREWKEKERDRDRTELSDAGSSTSSGSSTSTVQQKSAPAGASQARLRKLSIRSSTQRPTVRRTASNTTISSSASAKSSSARSAPAPSAAPASTATSTTKAVSRQRSSSRLHQQTTSTVAASSTTTSTKPTPVPIPAASKSQPPPAPVYDLSDEENLPSPFLKKVDKDGKIYIKPSSSSSASATAIVSSGATIRVGVPQMKKRPSTSGGNYLRAMAAANNVASGKRAVSVLGMSPTKVTGRGGDDENVNEVGRPALVSARRAGEEARKALLR